MNKFKNILKFAIVFLSGDLILTNESPDYIMEKFDMCFGNIKIKKHTRITKLYKKHNEIWKHDDYRLNSIFNFLIDINRYSCDSDLEIKYDGKGMFTSAPRNIRCRPESYIELFNMWIGNFSDIKDDDVTILHSVLIRDMYNIYINSIKPEYLEFFTKLERKEKLLKIKKYDK